MGQQETKTFPKCAESIVQTIWLRSKPWFVANDVASALGFTVANMHYHIRCNIEATEKVLVKLVTGKGGSAISPDSGLYKLAKRSDKKEAKAFQDRVTKTVLPAIRKDGAGLHPPRFST